MQHSVQTKVGMFVPSAIARSRITLTAAIDGALAIQHELLSIGQHGPMFGSAIAGHDAIGRKHSVHFWQQIQRVFYSPKFLIFPMAAALNIRGEENDFGS